jgi:hypothetical protein
MNDSVTIRRSTEQDAAALRNLAELDSRRPSAGQALLAFIGDELHAALPLNGEPALADPFRRTAELVELLSLCAAQELNPGRTRGAGALSVLRPRVA